MIGSDMIRILGIFLLLGSSSSVSTVMIRYGTILSITVEACGAEVGHCRQRERLREGSDNSLRSNLC